MAMTNGSCPKEYMFLKPAVNIHTVSVLAEFVMGRKAMLCMILLILIMHRYTCYQRR